MILYSIFHTQSFFKRCCLFPDEYEIWFHANGKQKQLFAPNQRWPSHHGAIPRAWDLIEDAAWRLSISSQVTVQPRWTWSKPPGCREVQLQNPRGLPTTSWFMPVSRFQRINKVKVTGLMLWFHYCLWVAWKLGDNGHCPTEWKGR